MTCCSILELSDLIIVRLYYRNIDTKGLLFVYLNSPFCQFTHLNNNINNNTTFLVSIIWINWPYCGHACRRVYVSVCQLLIDLLLSVICMFLCNIYMHFTLFRPCVLKAYWLLFNIIFRGNLCILFRFIKILYNLEPCL